MSSYMYHSIKIMKMDRSPDVELAKKIYDYYCSEEDDFSELWELNEGTLSDYSNDYGSGKDESFVREIQEKFHAEKIRDDILMEATSGRDISIGILDNARGGTDTINENWQNLIFVAEDESSNEEIFKDYSNNRLYNRNGDLWTVSVNEEETSLAIDNDGNLIALNFNNMRLIDEDGSYVNIKDCGYQIDLSADFSLEETGEEVEVEKVKGRLKISYFKKDPNNKDALQKIYDKIGGTVDLEKGTLDFEVGAGDIKSFFTTILRGTTFNCSVEVDSGKYSFAKGECTFVYEY